MGDAGSSDDELSASSQTASQTGSGGLSPQNRLDEVLDARRHAHEQQGVAAERTGVGRERETSASSALAYAQRGCFAAGRLTAVMVSEACEAELAAALRLLLERSRSPRLLVLDMRHVTSTAAGAWWEWQVAPSLSAADCLLAVHAPVGLALAGGGEVRHRGGELSALPAIQTAYREILRELPRSQAS